MIFLFMEGGPSHLDTFDPKPELVRLAGQSLPPSFKPVITPMGEGAPAMAPKRRWQQHGQSGIWVSDWLPNIATCVDDIAVIRSCWSNGLNHVGGVCQMNTGSTLAGRPSLGSWVTYGLGTENANLPGFVVMQDFPRAQVAGGPRNWGTGFMPAVYQGTRLDGGAEPFANLKTPADVGQERQEQKLEYLGRLNRGISVADGPIRARCPHQELRAGLPHASGSARGGRPVTRDGGNAVPLWHGRPGYRDHRPPLPAGASTRRARRAVYSDLLRCGQSVGLTRRHRSEPCAKPVAPWIGQSRACSKI